LVSRAAQLLLFDVQADTVPEPPAAQLEVPSGPQTQPGPRHDEDGRPAQSQVSATVAFVRDARARRYLIRVRADGTVRVTIPRRGSRREAVAFYGQQQQWIRTQQQRVADWRKSLPPDLPDPERRALQDRARRELPARLLELAEQVGLVVRRVSVRNQRRRWGSCSTSGLICLNWRLITMPDWVRDYVMYHELMHLKCMNHSPRFWKLVADVCPEYERACEWLRRHGHAPHAADGQGVSD
jgi:predicted metal-dependent hydrolase